MSDWLLPLGAAKLRDPILGCLLGDFRVELGLGNVVLHFTTLDLDGARAAF